MSRVVVFIDYQNLYHGAREAFGSPGTDRPTFGHVRPLRLGLLLTQLGDEVDPSRELTQVRVYRGEPGPQSLPALQSAFQRQVAAWERRRPVLEVIRRPLRYRPTAWDQQGRACAWDKGREKGIDVLIALDMALSALRDDYDVAILFSGDTDLIPAIDAVVEAGKRVENAVWKPDHDHPRPLRSTKTRLWCHQLDRRGFESVRDDTNYLEGLGDPDKL
ncbi:MAG: NYN domain-containing protein [Candidatus Dormibacteria bacterium]